MGAAGGDSFLGARPNDDENDEKLGEQSNKAQSCESGIVPIANRH
jgi:hypothetical protein